MSDDRTDRIDVTGLICPLPVLKIARRLKSMASGAELAVIASDPATQIDVPHYCAESGNALVSSFVDGGYFHYTIRRA